MSSPIVEAFDYIRGKYGWKIIAIRPRSKVPVFKKWTGPYWENIHRNFLSENPHANIGILLGEVIDIEADTPEANCLAASLIGKTPHLSYRSERSIHHLFTNPFRNINKIVWRGIEFRAYGHQSLLPPSINRSGNQYQWVDQSDICLLPKNITELLKQLSSYKVSLSSPRCSICGQECKIASSRFKLESSVYASMSKKWIGKCCRKEDIRFACRKIKRQIK